VANGTFDGRRDPTVEDFLDEPELKLELVAGSTNLSNEVTWVHVVEVEDPTPFLGGGELVLATGLGIARGPKAQRAYLHRLLEKNVAGLGFGVGFSYQEVPQTIADEAERLEFPVLAVPYDVPFIAITKYAFTRLAEHRLRMLTAALDVQERLVSAALHGGGLEEILGMLCSHVHCAAVLVDSTGNVLAQRQWPETKRGLANVVELPVTTSGSAAILRVARKRSLFTEYELLVLRHSQMALGFELARRGAVSAAELRLAGDLLDDLEHERLDESDATKRLAAFGLDSFRELFPLLITASGREPVTDVRAAASRIIDLRGAKHLSAARAAVATFVVQVETEDDLAALANEIARLNPSFRLSLGRGAHGRRLGHSLLEAHAVLQVGKGPVISYRDLGPLELLLNLPAGTLEGFVERTIGPLLDKPRLLESVTAVLASGGRWSDAARSLGVHRHTLRYRMAQVHQLLGRDPSDPDERMEVWLALLAQRALADRFAALRTP
jgi:PucR family transcriptional regulator, purine catabolism regulatory protein